MSSTYVDGVTPLDASHMNALQQKVEKAAANGYASLDSGGKVPLAQLPPVGADLIYDGDFAAGPTYKDGEIVVYQDASGNKVAYMCTSPTTNAPTPWPGGPPAQPAYPRPTYGTTLPASPVDGQEHILVDSLTSPTYSWHFRYNASSTSAYKWEFVGGAPAYSFIDTQENMAATAGAWVNCTTPGPDFVMPRSGDYFITFEGNMVMGAAGSVISGIGVANASVSSSPPGQTALTTPISGGYAQLSGQTKILAASGNQTLRLQYYTSVTSPLPAYRFRSIAVTPVRVS